jgi:N utilization substance protein B
MGSRRTARERALQALYQLEMTDGKPTEALESAWAAAGAERPDPEAEEFARKLVEGVWSNVTEIDAVIQTHSHHWRVERMTRIDRNVLRLGIFELKYLLEIPGRVSINEAVELGKRFGTEESSAFINGLLDRIASTLQKT